MGIFSNFFNALKKLFAKSELNSKFYDGLEELLISSDIGFNTSLEIVDELKAKIKSEKTKDLNAAKTLLREILIDRLDSEQIKFDYPMAISVFGVNGVGKTTTIAKMSNFFVKNKKSVLLVAGDTFRAGAITQLSDWANKVGVKVIKQDAGADAGSVVFDGISSAKAKNTDVLIVDTAGRLHTNVNLMKELQKIDKIIIKEYEKAHKINLIVVDASIGQNSLQQVKTFQEHIDIDGIVVTKLDGTAKGGVVFQITEQLNVPIIFTCFGEKLDDIALFNAKNYVDKILM